MSNDLIPISRRDIHDAAPFRPPGYVAALAAAGVRHSHTNVYITKESYIELPVRFPTLLKAREYSAEEAASDTSVWPIVIKHNPANDIVLTPTPAWGSTKWSLFHNRPLIYSRDVFTELAWIYKFSIDLPSFGCSCRYHWASVLYNNPPTLYSNISYAKWIWERHNDVNLRLRKKQFSWKECVKKYNYPDSWLSKEDLILVNRYSPGDTVIITGVVNALKEQYPEKFRIAVKTTAQEIWQNNPSIVDEKVLDHPKIIDLYIGGDKKHLVENWADALSYQLKIPIDVKKCRGFIYLNEQEKQWPNLLPKSPYWILNAGSKKTCQTKKYPKSYWEKIICHFKNRINFVRIGRSDGEHLQPELDGVINLIDKTTIRELIQLIYFSDGVVTPISLPMHLAAAVPIPEDKFVNRPCVVIAGGREPPIGFSYPGQIAIHNVGDIECSVRGCWKSDLELQPNKENDLCLNPSNIDGDICAKCMELISPQEVIKAIESYLK